MVGDRQLIIFASSSNLATKYKYAEVLKLPFDVGDAENGSQFQYLMPDRRVLSECDN